MHHDIEWYKEKVEMSKSKDKWWRSLTKEQKDSVGKGFYPDVYLTRKYQDRLDRVEVDLTIAEEYLQTL